MNPHLREVVTPLTEAQTERLALLTGQLAGAIEVISKIMRHGYDSPNPYDQLERTNQQLLEREMGSILSALKLLNLADDIDEAQVLSHAKAKILIADRWTRHQGDLMPIIKEQAGSA